MLTETLALVAARPSRHTCAPMSWLDSPAVWAVVVAMVNVRLLGLFFRDRMVRAHFSHATPLLADSKYGSITLTNRALIHGGFSLHLKR